MRCRLHLLHLEVIGVMEVSIMRRRKKQKNNLRQKPVRSQEENWEEKLQASTV